MMRVLICLFAAAALASCITAAQNSPAPTAIDANTDLTPADMAALIANDQQLVRNGFAPPEVVKYDLELSKLVPEGQDILAKRDAVRARAWSQRMHGVVASRNQVLQAFAAKASARAAAAGGFQVNSCLNEMGQNTCQAPEPEPQRMCTVGGGGTVGLAPC